MTKQSYLEQLFNDKGFSLRKSKPANEGYMVSKPNCEKVIPLDHITEADIKNFKKANKKELKAKDCYMGAWLDDTSNLVYLDVSINTKSKEKAIELGYKHNQLAIFDLNNFETIRL